MTSQYFGVLASFFVLRKVEAATTEFFEETLLFELYDIADAPLKEKSVGFDNKERPWLVDTVLFQMLVTDPARQKTIKEAQDIAKQLKAAVGERNVVGFSLVEMYNCDEIAPAYPNSKLRMNHGNITVDVLTFATEKQSIHTGSKLIASLEHPAGMNDEQIKEFRINNGRKYLIGLEAELVIPETLGHKVRWLREGSLSEVENTASISLQTLESQIINAGNTILSIQSIMNDRSSLLQSLPNLRSQLIFVGSAHTWTSQLEGLLQIQLTQLHFFGERHVFADLCHVYAMHCETSQQSIQSFSKRLVALGETGRGIHDFAHLDASTHRDELIKNAECVVAALGLGLAAIAIVDGTTLEGFFARFNLNKIQLAILLIVIRGVIFASVSTLAWKLVGSVLSDVGLSNK